MPPANRELHVVAGVVIFPTHPGPHVNLLRVGKTLCAKATVREENHVPSESLRCLLLQGSGFMGIRPWVREIWFHEQGPRGVFGPFEDSFPIVIPARPGKILAIREFHVMHECVFFPTCPGSRINFVASQEDSARKRGNVGGKIPEALHRGELGFARYDLANRGRWKMVKEQSVRFSFWSGQRSGQTSVKLGQLRSNLVNLGQTWSNLGKCVPDPVLRLFGVMSPRRNRPTWFGLPRFACRHPRKFRGYCEKSSSVCMSLSVRRAGCQSVDTRVKSQALISRSGSPFALFEAANRVVSTVWNLSPNRLRGDLTWGLPKLQIGWFQRFGISVQTAANRVVSTVWNLSPNRLRGDLTWELPKLQIGWFQRFGISVQTDAFTEAVVAEIVAGPHALDSCECMNIEGQILRKT
uniref:Uncharacterized protein n=1 Tax=Fagus sylvatica TaxID=28930 RepID=A0A2N9HA35_FAGSY